MRVNHIKGSKIYVYRNSNYLEPIRETVTYKVRKSDTSEVWYIYVRKRSKLFTALMILIALLCVYVNIKVLPEFSAKVMYSSYADYWNNNLYINLELPEDAKVNVYYTILDQSGILHPGDSVVYIPVDDCADSVELGLKYFDYERIPYSYHTIIVNKIQE